MLRLILNCTRTIQKFGAKLNPRVTVISYKKILMHCMRGLEKTKCHFIPINAKLYLYTTLDLNSSKFFHFLNMIGSNDIDFSVCEKDLGVLVNERFRWEDHHSKVLNKAHQMLGFTKRTCHFKSDTRKRRTLYLSLVRSNFEHASIIWRPTTETAVNEFEQLQKKALKSILKEENLHYDEQIYLKKC